MNPFGPMTEIQGYGLLFAIGCLWVQLERIVRVLRSRRLGKGVKAK